MGVKSRAESTSTPAPARAGLAARSGRFVGTPALLLLLVLGLDAIRTARRWPVPIDGMLDEPAHLSTALLVLLALAGPSWLLRHRTFTLGALLASMAIDVDHVPLYAGVQHIAEGGRPYSHSLFTAAVLGTCALIFARRRALLAGLAAGVVLHFVRDVATGPGLILWWPLSFRTVLLPYSLYLVVLVAATTLATARIVVQHRAEHRDRPGAPA